MGIRIRVSRLLCGSLIALCLDSPQAAVAASVARVHSVLGGFDLELLEDSAPATVANFLNCVRDGDYVDMFFHRSVPRFVIPDCGFTFDEIQDQPVPVPTDPPIADEFNVSNTRGTVAKRQVVAGRCRHPAPGHGLNESALKTVQSTEFRSNPDSHGLTQRDGKARAKSGSSSDRFGL